MYQIIFANVMFKVCLTINHNTHSKFHLNVLGQFIGIIFFCNPYRLSPYNQAIHIIFDYPISLK